MRIKRKRGTWVSYGLSFSLIISLLIMTGSSALAQEKKYSYKNQNKRDPFVPLISPAGYLLNLEPEDNSVVKLEGIMYDPHGDSIAIINGSLVRVGETIGDAVLSSIEANKITVIKDNQKVDIELRREE
jgi:hypothetical protein